MYQGWICACSWSRSEALLAASPPLLEGELLYPALPPVLTPFGALPPETSGPRAPPLSPADRARLCASRDARVIAGAAPAGAQRGAKNCARVGGEGSFLRGAAGPSAGRSRSAPRRATAHASCAPFASRARQPRTARPSVTLLLTSCSLALRLTRALLKRALPLTRGMRAYERACGGARVMLPPGAGARPESDWVLLRLARTRRRSARVQRAPRRAVGVCLSASVCL